MVCLGVLIARKTAWFSHVNNLLEIGLKKTSKEIIVFNIRQETCNNEQEVKIIMNLLKTSCIIHFSR